MSGAAVQLEMTRPAMDWPWVVWGGLLPSGSLKHLTFEHYLAGLEPSQHAGWIEMSEGCTALALDWFAQRRSVPLAVVCSPEGAESLRSKGFRGELIVPRSLAEGFQTCRSRQADGWHWPQQLCNPQLVSAVCAWAPRLEQLLSSAPEIDTVVTGFGTGATLLGLSAALAPMKYRVLGFEAPPNARIPGLRNYAQQNLGELDLYYGHRNSNLLRTARMPSGPSCSILELLRSQDFGCAPAQVCIVSHDGVPPCA